MSLYPPHYGQPAYGGPSSFAPQLPPPVAYHQQYPQYHQPPPPQPQPPAPAPYHHVDPLTFRRDLTSRLSNLTFNSKFHIQDISVFAADYPQWADIVAQCIDQHIRQVSDLSSDPLDPLFEEK